MDLNHFENCFLIAMPELEDPNFSKTVILLTNYNSTGASGFVINRHTNIKLCDTIILDNAGLNPDYNEVRLYYGGPIDPEKIWIIYDGKIHSNPEDTAIGQNVVIAKDIDILTNHEKTLDTSRFRIFHGFSGWGEQQLEEEIAVSAWITCPLSSRLLFDTPTDKIWEEAIKELGIEPNKLVGQRSAFLN